MDQSGTGIGASRGHIGLRQDGFTRRASDLTGLDAAYDDRQGDLFGESMAKALVASTPLRDTTQVIGRRLFYSNNDIHVQLRTGMTIDEMLVAIGWDMSARPFTVVYIGGMEILEPLWCKVRPKPGTQLFVSVRPGFKGAGGKILMAIAAIAIMVVAFYAAPALVAAFGGTAYVGAAAGAYSTVAAGTALSTSSLIVSAGISSIASLALSALVKPPSVDALSGLQSAATGSIGSNAGATSAATAGAEAKSYGLTVSSNTARLYSPVPRVLGRHRVTPNLAAETYVISEGGVQTAIMLLDFGEGPLLIDDLKVGTTPINNYQSVEYRWHPDFQKGKTLSFYEGDQATQRVDVSIEKNVDIVRVVSQSADSASIEIQAPSGLISVNSANERVVATYDVEIYYAEVGQPWTAVRNASPTVLFRGDAGVGTSGFIQVGSLGMVSYNSDSRAFRMAVVHTTVSVGMSVLLGDGVYYRITKVEMIPPDAGNQPSKPYAEHPHAYITTDGLPSSITIQGMVNAHQLCSLFNTIPTPTMAGNWDVYPYYAVNDATIRFDGRTQTAQSATIRLTFPYRANWQIYVVGRTDAFIGINSINQLKWNVLRASRVSVPVAPMSPRSLLEVRITASEDINGQIGAFNALVTSITQLWDGNWRPTRNPADLVLEILTGRAAVKKVPWAEINTTAFYNWQQWCAAPSAQGDVRCTCDMIVDTRTTVGDLVTLIASNGRAAITVVDGKYDVLMEDTVRVPVQMFTERNTKGVTTIRSWVDQPHAVKTTFVNENTWEKDEIYVYADGYDAASATKFETLALTGCVRGPQAWRDGRYYMAASELRRERVEFETDLENIVCARGDMVLFSHDVFYGAIGARVQSLPGSNRLQLDVTLEDTDYDVAEVRYSDGTIERQTITVISEDVVSITGRIPQTNDLLTIGKSVEEVTGWIVDSVVPGPNLSAKITLMERAEDILLADRGPIPPYVPPGGNGQSPPMNAATNLHISSYEAVSNGRQVYNASLTWTPPVGVNVSRYEIHQRWPDVVLGAVTNPPFDFQIDRLSLPRPEGETKEYYVEAVTPRGRRSISTSISALWVPETTSPQILRFSANVVGTQALLFWEIAAGAPDLESYQIRFSDNPQAQIWDQMTIAIERVSGIATTATFLRRTGVYAIRAVDRGGNWSAPLFTTIVIEYPETLDLYTRLVGDPAWVGELQDVVVNNGRLELAPGKLEGWWFSGNNVFEPQAWRFRTRGEIEASVANSQFPNDWNAEIWVSSLGESPTLDSAWFQPLANAIPLAGVAAAYQPIRALQTTDIDATIVRWAIRLSRATTVPIVSVSKAALVLDHYERTEFGSDIAIPAAGLRIPFYRKYFHPPSVTVTIEGTATVYRYTKVTSKDDFFVQVYDINNQPVAAQIDWQSLGYGRQAQ